MAQENINSNNKDWLDRKVDGFLNIVKAMGQDSKTVILTGSVILNFWLGNRLIKQTEDLSKVIIEEVRKQSPSLIKEETQSQLKETKERIDTTLNQVKRKLDIGEQNGEQQ